MDMGLRIDVTKRRRGRPSKAVTYAESEAEGDDAASVGSGQQETGKKQRKGGKTTEKKQKNGVVEKVPDEDGELSQASDLTMAPSSPVVPKDQPKTAAEASSEEGSATKPRGPVQPSLAETQSNKEKPKKSRANKTGATSRKVGIEEGGSSSVTKMPEPEMSKSKSKPVPSKPQETASKRSTGSVKQKVIPKKTAKTGAATKPKAATSSAASSPKKTTKVKRNGKAQPAVPTSKQITDGIEAMYFGSSQPYASGTTLLSDSESSDEDERIKVSRLFDPVKRTPQKRKGKDVEEVDAGKTKKAKKGKKGQDEDVTSAEETAAESEIEYPKLRRDLE